MFPEVIDLFESNAGNIAQFVFKRVEFSGVFNGMGVTYTENSVVLMG